MQFALEDFETMGRTSAGKALLLAGLGRPVTWQTLMGDDATSVGVRDALAAAGIEVIGHIVRGHGERHL